MIDILQTERTYKTREKALNHLTKQLATLVIDGEIRYFIATNTEGRFAPVVFLSKSQLNQGLAVMLVHLDITVIG